MLNRIGAIFFIAAWLLPNHYPPWVNFHSEFLAFAGIAILVGGLILKSTAALKIPKISNIIFLIIFIILIQCGYGLVFFTGDAVISLVYLLGLVLAVVLGYSYTEIEDTDFGSVWLLPAVMLFSAALISACVGYVQWLGLPDSYTTYAMQTEPGGRIIANLGQPNQLATLLLMGIVALMLIFDQGLTGRLGFILGMVFLTWALVLCESRTALLSVAIIAVFLICKGRHKESNLLADKHLEKFLWVWLLGFCFATYALPFVNKFLFLEAGRGIEFADNNGRVLIWRQTLAAIADAPWFGYGWSQTQVAQASGALKFPGELAYSNAHNLLLDLMAWVGVPFGMVIFGVLLYWVWTRALSVQKPQAIYAVAMLLPFFVHSLLEFPFVYAYFLLSAGLLVGVIEACYSHAKPLIISKKLGSGVLALFALFGCFFGYEYLLIEEDYRFARFENLRVGRTPVEYQRPDIQISTQLASLLRVLRQPAIPEMSKDQMALLQKVSLRFGMRPLVFRYAVALGLNGDPEGAAKQMQLVRSMFGNIYYNTAKAEMLRLAVEEYPQLNAVKLP